MTTDPHTGAELTDDALQGEIELVGDLVVAASSSEGPLSDEEIDAALGIERAEASERSEAGESDQSGESGESDESDPSGRTSSHRAAHESSFRQHA